MVTGFKCRLGDSNIFAGILICGEEVPVVCKKACVHSRYTETSIQDGKLF